MILYLNIALKPCPPMGICIVAGIDQYRSKINLKIGAENESITSAMSELLQVCYDFMMF